MNSLWKFLMIMAISCCSTFSCELINERLQTDKSQTENKDLLLATAYNNRLYNKDIHEMIPRSLKGQDSIVFVNNVVENWVKEKLMLVEAERNFPTDIDLEKLVEDYRSSLLKHHYELEVLSSDLDTAVNQQQLENFYQENKQDYKLNDPIFRLKYIKLPKSSPDFNELEPLIFSDEADEIFKLTAFCNTYAESFTLKKNNWFTRQELNFLLPAIKASHLNGGKLLKSSDDFYNYYIYTLEKVEINQIPPLSYVEEKAKSVIIQRRKINLLEKKQKDLFERALKNEYVKIY